MTRLEDELRKFKEEYEGVSRKAAEYIEKSPEGYLRISECNSRKQYYQVNSDNSGKYYNGKYLRKDKIQIAKALAQKEYAQKLLKITDERVRQANNFLMAYEEDELGKVYSNLSVQRKELITPIVFDDEEYARRWMAVEYRRKPEKIYYNEYGQKKPETEYYSKRNEKVRSNCYTKNGYIPGDNLMYSFESSEYPVNLTVIEKQVRSVLRL